MPLIGDKAPAFEAVTTEGSIKFLEDHKGNESFFFSTLQISLRFALQKS